MKPEFLLLIQQYCHQQVYLNRVLETLSVLYAKQEGFDNEKSQAFAKLVDDRCSSEYDLLLQKMLQIVKDSFPDDFGNESIEELLKRISLS